MLISHASLNVVNLSNHVMPKVSKPVWNPVVHKSINYTSEFQLLQFLSDAGSVYIDATPLSPSKGKIYIVPPGHLAITTECVTGLIKTETLRRDELSIYEANQLIMLAYNGIKYLDLDATCNASQCDLRTGFIKAIGKLVRPEFKKAISRSANEVAAAFHEWITAPNLELGKCSVPQISGALFHHERTLRRACLSTFGLSPTSIVRYHLTIDCIYYLLGSELSIEEIAEKLAFSDPSKLSRFIKHQLKTSPSALRGWVTSN